MEAETTYFKYLKDVSSTRVSLQPKPDMDLLTDMEARIENSMRTLLMNAVPPVINQQWMFLEDLNVHSGALPYNGYGRTSQ